MLLGACSGSTKDVGPRPDPGPSGDAGSDGATDPESGAPSDGGTDAAPDVLDGGDGGDAGAWTPKKLAGLSVWLDDTVGIVKDPAKAGRIKRWLDQSGNGNDANGEGGDGITMSPALDPSAIAGKDAVVCDLQTILRIPSTPSVQFGTSDFAILMVAKLGALGGSGITLYHKTDIQLLVLSTAELRMQASSELLSIPLVPTDKFLIFSARGKALDLRAGSASTTGATSTADLSGGNVAVTLCQGTISTTPSIAEVIVVKGTVNDADLALTTGYLKKKFGL